MRSRTFAGAARTAAVVLTVAAAAPAALGESTPLTKAQYLAALRSANAETARAETAALGALQARGTTAAQVRARFRSWGATESRSGAALAALVPPAAARAGNSRLAAAERTLGAQLATLAARLPATKVAMVRLLLGTNLSGKALIDRAVAELRAAGFRT